MKKTPWLAAFSGAIALSSVTALATDYYVATTGNDENSGTSAESPFATIDKAISSASAGDTIYVAPGTYSTTTQYGPNLSAKLVGLGDSPAVVTISAGGNQRTMKTTSTGWIENVSLVGQGTSAVSTGGTVYMEGGTITNCVIRGGTATTNGGNIYMNSAGLLVDCVISNGMATTCGGNIYMKAGSVMDSTISNGTANGTGWADGGGNVFMTGGGTLSRCTITGGAQAANQGGGIRCRESNNIVVEDCLVANNNGGGICFDKGNLYNCTIVANAGRSGVWGYRNDYGNVVNCVVFGNTDASGGTKEWSGNKVVANIVNIASSDTATFTSVTEIDATAFADYANGDYHPAVGGALVDAGSTDPRTTGVSATDLDGYPRTSGSGVDIGCYEYQKPGLAVHIDNVAFSQTFAPATVTFTHSTDNSASPENVVFTYDFGDNSTNETTSAATISHKYASPGIYTITITATNSCEEEEAELVYDSYVRVTSSTIYVTAGNSSAAFPYNTIETGYATLTAAVADAVDGCEIIVGDGVYVQTAPIEVSAAVRICGNDGNPEAVVLRNTATATSGNYNKRVMTVSSSGAWISGLTMENGQVFYNFGGDLYISAGTVSNCVIRGGTVTANSSNNAGCGGGVAFADNGLVTHCVITNNIVDGSAKDQSTRGAAVMFRYGSAGKLCNSLVAHNVYRPSTENIRGTAGLFYGGSNNKAVVENCTVAANVVEGTISDESAGVYCNAYTTFRNTVFAGNVIRSSGSETIAPAYIISGATVVNCATDGNSTLNGTCYVGTAANMFKNFAAENFAPLPGGILYNKGTTPSEAVSVDIAGNQRVMFDKIDVGCYECQIEPSTLIIFR